MSIKRRKDRSLPGKSKRSRISLTSLQKREMCEVKCEYPRLTLADLATQFKCGISTVSDILKVGWRFRMTAGGRQGVMELKYIES